MVDNLQLKILEHVCMPDAIPTLQKQVEFIANGQQDEETKSLFRASVK